MGRLIDADELKRDLTYQIPLAENVPLFKEIIDSHPTAYDVDKVVDQIVKTARKICMVTMCNADCVNCELGCLMNAICKIVKGGSV